MENSWHTKKRDETANNRMSDRLATTDPKILVSNPALGINIYSGALTAEQGLAHINVLESKLNGQTQFKWNGAHVTTSEEVDLYARNAKDFKFNSKGLGPRTEETAELYDVHGALFNALRSCVDDYGSYWGVGIRSYEAFNFVKYEGPGTHFRIHADHGPTYVSTISAVIYLNDDYEGGELIFPRFNLTIKPKAGDIVVFPSTFIYEHSSEQIISGNKYAVVVMTDYNDRDSVNHRVSQVVEDYKLSY